MGNEVMRVTVSFMIIWLLAPATTVIAVADTAAVEAVAPNTTPSPPQPTLEEDLLNLLD